MAELHGGADSIFERTVLIKAEAAAKAVVAMSYDYATDVSFASVTTSSRIMHFRYVRYQTLITYATTIPPIGSPSINYPELPMGFV